MRSPNWTSEELMLALELYLNKDMKWHSKISNNTWEILALSELLRGLDIITARVDSTFRSPSSIRLKFANFKFLDERYRNYAMSNVGKQDKVIWDRYHLNYIELKKHAKLLLNHIIEGSRQNI